MKHQLPLHRIQHKFWADSLLKDNDIDYNDPNATFVVDGDLDINVLQEAYRLIMREYPPLMSTIEVIDGQPVFIYDETQFRLPFESINIPTETGEDEFVSQSIEKMTSVPFNLESECPCRFVAFIGKQRTYLYHLFHHIVMDGRTLFVFFKRVSEIHGQLKHNSYQEQSQVQDLLAYNEMLHREYTSKREKNIHFWKQYIGDTPLRLPLPLKGKITEPSSAINAAQRKSFIVEFELGRQRYQEVKDFCRQRGTTPFRLFASVWAITLAKICRTDQLLLDHALNLCPQSFSNLLGVFINNLPLRYDFTDPNMSFLEVIDEANRHRLEERDKTCIFYHDLMQHETLNIGINYPLRLTSLTMELEGCSCSLFRHVHVPLAQDLVLSIEDNEACDCAIFFKPNIERAYPQALANAFTNILNQVLLHPEMKIGNLETLTQEEVEQRVKAENNSLQKAVRPGVFLTAFNECVSQYGSHTAIELGDDQVSYCELNEWSNRIAAYLVEQGYERKRIGLANDKTRGTIAAILGIMKSRNAYVPIDVNLPKERLLWMVKDSGVSLIILPQERQTELKLPSITVDEIVRQSLPSNSTDVNLDLPLVNPDDEAYIIYTSGSTGRPKGIPILHRMLNQTIQANISIQQLYHDTRSTQFANLSFDASIVEIFPTLCVGGTIVVVEEEYRKDARLFFQFLERKQITECNIPPVILSSLPQARLPHLKTIIFGGDRITAGAAAYWSQHHRLINAYGPTENAVDATYSILNIDSKPNDIGKSMEGVVSFVMDNHLRLLPDGIVGELCIGGVKLTEGYLNNEAQNSLVFVDNPYCQTCGTNGVDTLRLYKTGDLVKRNENGNLLFIGRKDFQVKVNGYRIELSEIESAITEFCSATCPQKVKDCVVVVKDKGNIKQLHAYIETETAKSFPQSELVAYLKGRLPQYMIPSDIITLREFPRTPSGKVDRKQLPEPCFIRSEVGYHPPVTITEKRLAKIWTSILGTPFIDRNDSFLALNGDSLAVIQLTFQVQAAFGVNVKASQIYNNPELKSLAQLIDDTLSSATIEDQLTDTLQSCFHRNDLSIDTDITSLGDNLIIDDFVCMAAKRHRLFLTSMDVMRYHTVRQLATNVDFSMVFWTEGHKTDKPIFVFFGGFVEYYPYHEAVVSCLEQRFSVLMVESYCHFFQNEKQIDIQQLWDAYHNLFTVALRDEEIFAIGGYCTGAEIALAFAQYMHQRHPEQTPYRVLNMEGVFNRKDGVYDLHNDSMADRIHISDSLYAQFPAYDYCGEMLIVMAGHPSNTLDPGKGEETDDKVLMMLRNKWESNINDWLSHFPNAALYQLDCMHLTFPEKKNLDRLLQILDDHYRLSASHILFSRR
ncbi:MAG: amino acid adenylation domain-containing protein [Prevotella sp.]